MTLKASIDLVLMAIAIIVWIVMAAIWATYIGMPEGSRVWVSGAVVFLVLFATLAIAERRQQSV